MFNEALNQFQEKASAFILESILQPVVAFLVSLPWWATILILLATILLIVIGFIRILSKSWKFIVVVAVLVGVGLIVYQFFFKKPAQVTTIKFLFSLIG